MSFFKRAPHADDLDPDDDDPTIDPELRLRTVRTAHSTIAESIRTEARAERRKSLRQKRSRFFRNRSIEKKRPATADSNATSEAKPSTEIPGSRRNIYVNTPLTAMEVDTHGEPLTHYVRNKVRTSKYTIITFLPKNLYEQFRRVANLYFLVLVVLQVFPMFGAASPQTAMLPLVFITAVTAIKDAIEDYRRAALDEEVNTSAATKLGNWRNLNVPTDPRPWLEKLLGLNPPGRVTRGVRRLREREAGEGMRIMLSRGDGDRVSMSTVNLHGGSAADKHGAAAGAAGRHLDDIQSVDSHSYPPDPSQVSLAAAAAGAQQQALDPAGPYAAAELGAGWSQTTTLAGDGGGAGGGTGAVNWAKRIGGSARWERTLWKKLEVGDVVLLRDNDQVPADIIVLSTSDPEGLCFLETKNLDGETNLKPRKAVHATSSVMSEEDVERAAFVLDSEPPHQNLYLYNGVLRYVDAATGAAKTEPVTIDEMLLRGCSLRNTAWVIGLVAFTGADTKIMLNGGETPSKRSRIERETNFNVIVNFVVLILMCAVTAVANGIFDGREGTSAAVFEAGADASDSDVLNALVTFASCLIAFQNIVPISLYISIEIVKTIQAYFISQDIDMYYAPFDTACVPKTWNISDDLGQIEYVFSDKTGTLTQNVMEFQKCSINGVAYGEAVTEAQRGAAKRKGDADMLDADEHHRRMVMMKQDMIRLMGRAFKNRYAQPDRLTLVSPRLAEDMADRTGAQRAHIAAFFRALAVCHTVLADRPDAARAPHLVNYKAESPDEAALVAAARDVGFPFVARTKESVEIEVLGQSERLVPLRVLAFDSTRKRMSTIVRDAQGRLVLYCKGADSVIYARLAREHDPALKERTARDMEAFANGGLRTLCVAYRFLGEEEYLQWSRVYDAAQSATVDRDEAIERANEMIEHSLVILGATALEDKLQEGVPDAIETLHQAGIKLWILTGDKVQTAIEIAFSCNLLKSDMDIMILSADSADGARAQIEAGLNKIASVLGPPSWDPRKRGFSPNAKASFAVVIDGDTLRHALGPALRELFLNLGTQCETVVCCRVSPAQKALTVKLVKEGRRAMTLAIGDGANDVAMIQEANIGCGLFGHEGSQAAMSADYAFGQFRFLTKLLVVHGRWSYRRIADMHSNFFYKNVIWTFAMFWFLPWNSFDATYLYQYTFILLYNVVFTSLPVIALGAFDQDINAKAALAFPQLYVRGIRGLEYTRAKFWLYMLDGLYQSAVVYFVPFCVWTLGPALSWNGKGIDSLADFGTTVSVAAIFAANIYVGINTHYWTVITWAVVLGSSIVMLVWIVIYSLFESFDFIDEVIVLFGGVTFWATVLLSVAIALTPRVLVKFVSSSYFPLDSDIVREMWVKGNLKSQLGLSHRRERKRGSDLEHAPMFQKPHSRSASEISSFQEGYEPALTSSPGELVSPPPPRAETLVDTPPPGNRSPYAGTQHLDDAQYQYQYATAPATAVPRDDGQHLLTPTAGPFTQNRLVSPSPAMSYYSASDVPLPSPLPSPTYSHPSHLYPSASASASASYATRPDTLRVPPSAYEMRIRSPPREHQYARAEPPEDWPQQQQHGYAHAHAPEPSTATTASYDTAASGPDRPHGGQGPDAEPDGGAADDWRASTYSYQGPRAL